MTKNIKIEFSIIYKMEDTDYQLPDDNEKIWRETSKWRPWQLKQLNAEFEDSLTFNQISSTDNIQLSNKAQSILLPNIDFSQPLNIDLTEDQLIYINRIKQTILFPNSEPPVDLIANDILIICGFESRLLHFTPKPKIIATCLNHRIVSVPDYAIYSEKSIMLGILEYFVVVEDKPIKRSNYQDGECQLYGEMLLAAIERFDQENKDQIIYSMLIKGPTIRFYKAIFKTDYLFEIINQNKPLNSPILYRYPPRNKRALNLISPIERNEILICLTSIKKAVETLASS